MRRPASSISTFSPSPITVALRCHQLAKHARPVKPIGKSVRPPIRVELIRRRKPDIKLHAFRELLFGQLPLSDILAPALSFRRIKAHLQTRDALMPAPWRSTRRPCPPGSPSRADPAATTAAWRSPRRRPAAPRCATASLDPPSPGSTPGPARPAARRSTPACTPRRASWPCSPAAAAAFSVLPPPQISHDPLKKRIKKE